MVAFVEFLLFKHSQKNNPDAHHILRNFLLACLLFDPGRNLHQEKILYCSFALPNLHRFIESCSPVYEMSPLGNDRSQHHGSPAFLARCAAAVIDRPTTCLKSTPFFTNVELKLEGRHMSAFSHKFLRCCDGEGA